MRSIDGHQLHAAFRSGASSLRAAEQRLNRINVFPVPDGDTGTNMAATLSYAVDTIPSNESVGAMLASMAEAALSGARGNSGVILAQFIAGFGESLNQAHSITPGDFVRAVENACISARNALAEPKEGTILTVIQDWVSALKREAGRVTTFGELFRRTYRDLVVSLEATTEKLEVLKRAGVVDAGAGGFVAFIDGAVAFFDGRAPELPRESVSPRGGRPSSDAGVAENHPVETTDSPGGAGHEPGSDYSGGLRYCAEFLVSGEKIDRASIRSKLEYSGDSLIVIGTGRTVRVHIHTDTPASVRRALAESGRIVEQKVDDMHRQWQDIHARVSRVAIVTDSSCDLPREMIDRHRIHVVPLLLRFGEDEYLDRLTIDPAGFYGMAASSPVFPTSSQPSPRSFERVYAGLLERYDEIVSIHISSKLSGTCESARRAAMVVAPERIHVVDSKHLSGSLGLVVLRSAMALGQGATARALVESLPGWSAGAGNLVSVRTLEFMVRGGRVSPLGGVLARVLNLKPIVSVDREGTSVLYGKAFSVQANLAKIVAMVLERHGREPLLWYAIVHADDPGGAERLAARLEKALGMAALYISDISAVVGMNAGRGAVSVVTMAV